MNDNDEPVDNDATLDALRARAAAESALLSCCICGAPAPHRVELAGGGLFPCCDAHEREAISALARSLGASDEEAEGFADHVMEHPEQFAGPEAN